MIALLHEPGAPEVIEGVVCRDGSYYRADRVILAAGAMTSPRILQDHLAVVRPRRDACPRAAMVGANFKLHLNSALVAFSPFTHHDVLRKTAIFFNERYPHTTRAVPRLARRRDPGDPAAGRGAEVRHQRDRRARLRLLRHDRGRLASRQPDRLRRRRRRHPDRRLQPRAPAAGPGRASARRSPTSPGACCTSGSPASTAISASPAARMRWARWSPAPTRRRAWSTRTARSTAWKGSTSATAACCRARAGSTRRSRSTPGACASATTWLRRGRAMIRLRRRSRSTRCVLAHRRAARGAARARRRAASTGIERVERRSAITVADLDRALAFYTGVLPFEVVAEAEVAGEAYEHLFGVFGLRARIARLRLGDEEIELIDYLAPEGRADPGGQPEQRRVVPAHRDHRQRHGRGLRAAAPAQCPARLERAADPARLEPERGRHQGVLLQGPRRQPPRDPAVPAGQGRRRGGTRRPTRLFLGIDHTAIVVRDTEREPRLLSRPRSGLRSQAQPRTTGTEQERLNNVFGARLRITSLGAPAGPGSRVPRLPRARRRPAVSRSTPRPTISGTGR